MTDIQPKWRKLRAFQVYEDLKFAPGNKEPLPPRRKSRRNMKLEIADAEITRCKLCGSWTHRRSKTCDHCTKNGYPVIDDLGRTA